MTEEPSRKKRDVQQKLETTFTDLVTTFDHGRPVVSTRRHTVTLGSSPRLFSEFFRGDSFKMLLASEQLREVRLTNRKYYEILGTLHITDTVHLPAATRSEPVVTRIVEPALVREHVPIDPRPVDHTYYTTYTYFTTTLSHGIPVTQTRFVKR